MKNFCGIAGKIKDEDINRFNQMHKSSEYKYQTQNICLATNQEITSEGNTKTVFAGYSDIYASCKIYEDKVILETDKLGLFPLFTREIDNNLYFSTKMESLIFNVNKLDRIAIEGFIKNGFVPEGRTFIEGIKKIKGTKVFKVMEVKNGRTKD